MNYAIINYILYTIISTLLTIWVGRTLHKHGRLFLIESMHGNIELADAVNHLLITGFYLVNLGFVVMFLKMDIKPTDCVEVFEGLSAKVGTVLLVLGGMHFFNLLVFHKIKKNSRLGMVPPPVEPDGFAGKV